MVRLKLLLSGAVALLAAGLGTAHPDGEFPLGRGRRRRPRCRPFLAGSRTTKPKRDDTSKPFCLALIGVAWAMVIINVVVSIRNGQRLSTDDFGWFLNSAMVGGLSIAPTVAISFAGNRLRAGSRGLAISAGLTAVPLVGLNLWMASEYVGDQMIGHQQLQERRQRLQEQRFAEERQLAERANAEVIRSKREAEERLWNAWKTARGPAEKAAHMKQLDKVRAETPNLTAAISVKETTSDTLGARANWMSKRFGWNKEVIDGITPTLVPAMMQMVELLFSFFGFKAWPRKEAADGPTEFNKFNPEFKLEDARRDIVQLIASRDLDAMKLSKAAFAKRWRVPTSTAWTWLQKFQAEGLIDSVATGRHNECSIRARQRWPGRG